MHELCSGRPTKFNRSSLWRNWNWINAHFFLWSFAGGFLYDLFYCIRPGQCQRTDDHEDGAWLEAVDVSRPFLLTVGVAMKTMDWYVHSLLLPSMMAQTIRNASRHLTFSQKYDMTTNNLEMPMWPIVFLCCCCCSPVILLVIHHTVHILT